MRWWDGPSTASPSLARTDDCQGNRPEPPATVQRRWKGRGPRPHRVNAFKLSRDPRSLGKLKDVAGLYLDPPEKAIVFSVQERSQIQALDRAAQAVRRVAPATLVKRNRRDWHSRLPLAMHHLSRRGT